MKTPSVTYPIRAVSLMTGVSIDTLRAWERRYNAVTPVRDGRGRIYSDADVRRIKRLRDAVAAGHAIGRVAAMSDEQLTRMALAGAPAVVAAARRAPRAAVVDTASIIEALERFDAATVETESFQERPDGSVRIEATIYVGRANHKAILIGAKGSRIREIGAKARAQLTDLLDRPVHLFLNVKERAGWDEEGARLRAIGLEDSA